MMYSRLQRPYGYLVTLPPHLIHSYDLPGVDPVCIRYAV